MYRTLKLTDDGDLDFNNLGQLNWIEDKESIEQTINIKLTTVKGELFYNYDFGLDDLMRRKNIDSTFSELESTIRDCLVDNDKIDDVSIANITKSEIPGKIYIDLEIILTDETMLNIGVNI